MGAPKDQAPTLLRADQADMARRCKGWKLEGAQGAQGPQPAWPFVARPVMRYLTNRWPVECRFAAS